MTAFLDDLQRQLSWLAEPLADALLCVERLREEAQREPPGPKQDRLWKIHALLVTIDVFAKEARELAERLSETPIAPKGDSQ